MVQVTPVSHTWHHDDNESSDASSKLSLIRIHF